jgi:hypothetical protein
MDRLIWLREIARALIWGFARALALTEKNGFFNVDIKAHEFPFDDEPAAIFHGVGIRRGGFDIAFID